MSIELWDRTQDGDLNEDNMRTKLEARGYRVTRYTYPPGTSFAEHTHNVDKIDAVLSGTFKIILPGKAIILRAGDCMAIPRGMPHSAEVIGNEPVVSLDAIRQ